MNEIERRPSIASAGYFLIGSALMTIAGAGLHLFGVDLINIGFSAMLLGLLLVVMPNLRLAHEKLRRNQRSATTGILLACLAAWLGVGALRANHETAFSHPVEALGPFSLLLGGLAGVVDKRLGQLAAVKTIPVLVLGLPIARHYLDPGNVDGRIVALTVLAVLAVLFASKPPLYQTLPYSILGVTAIALQDGRLTTALAVVLGAMAVVGNQSARVKTRAVVGSVVSAMLIAIVSISQVGQRFLDLVVGSTIGQNDPVVSLPLTDLRLWISLNGRLELWDFYLANSKMSLAGCGTNCHLIVATDLHTRFSRPHNEAIAFLIDYGLIGILLLSLAAFALLAQALLGRKYSFLLLFLMLVSICALDNVFSAGVASGLFGLALGNAWRGDDNKCNLPGP